MESTPHLPSADSVPFSALRADLIAEARNHARLRNPKHAWSHLEDEALLKATGLLRQDPNTGGWSVTPAGILLFGPDSVISRLFPHIRTRIVRRDRPDGKRLEIQAPLNILEAFGALLNVVSDSFPASGASEWGNHASLESNSAQAHPNPRDATFEILFGDFVKKRDYYHATPVTFKLDLEHFALEFAPAKADSALESESSLNADLTSFWDALHPEAKVGLESPSTLKTMQAYFGGKPLILHGKMFKFLALRPTFQNNSSKETATQNPPKPSPNTPMQVSAKLAWKDPAAASRRESAQIDWNMPKTMQVSRTARILEFCIIPRNREEIQQHLGMNNRDHFRKEVLKPLIEKGRLRPTIPDKPNSPKQQYVTVSD